MPPKIVQRSFAGGEITPELLGRNDLAKFQNGAQLMRNFIALPHGPADRRPGTEFVNECLIGAGLSHVRLMPFQFSATQSVVLEFGDQYVRFHSEGATVTEAAKTITGITQPAGVITSNAHGFSNGDWVYLSGIVGMTQLNGRWVVVSDSAANTFRMKDFWGNYITTGSYTAYSSGGTAARAYTLTSPWDEGDVHSLVFSQDADIITITHPSYPAKELRRLAAASWTITDVNFTPTLLPPGSTGTVLTITGISQANPGVVTYTGTDPANGDVLYLAGIGGMTALNNRLVTVTGVNTVANTFQLYYSYLAYTFPIDTTLYPAFTSGGTATTYSTGVTATATATTAGKPTTQEYVVTSIASDGITESAASAIATCSNDLSIAGNYNTITWTAVTGASRYYVYKRRGGSFGYIGQTGGLTVKDENILADTTQVPPEEIITLNKYYGDYPVACAHHEQRRWFGGTPNDPQAVWCTRTGTESNLMSSIPSKDADAILMRVKSNQYNSIRHLVPFGDLLAFTVNGEFRIFADNAPAITPTSVSVKPQSNAGAAAAAPVVTTSSVLYVQGQGGRIREIAYSGQAQAYQTTDMSIMAPHRFDGYSITQLAFSRSPDAILWAVRDDGVLLGMTYVPDQQVWAWHAHDTSGGVIESVCVVNESGDDRLYMVVQRTVNSRTVRYIERLKPRLFDGQEDAFYVDCGLTYSGTATTSVTGLYHLEGVTVDILADGAVKTRQTVTSGTVTLDSTASLIHVGIPITSDLQTLPLDKPGVPKNVNIVHLRVRRSSVVKAGPTFDRLQEYPNRAASDAWGSPPSLQTGEISIAIGSSWNTEGTVCIRQELPLPLMVLSVAAEVQLGG